MKGLIGSMNVSSYVSSASNGKYIVRNLRKNADGSLSFDLQNDTKGNVTGLTLPAGKVVTDAEGIACELREGDVVASAADRSDPKTALILRIAS